MRVVRGQLVVNFTLSSSGARLMSPRFNPLKKPLMTMRPAAMRMNHHGVDMVVLCRRRVDGVEVEATQGARY